MKINNLAALELSEIIDCMLIAFEGYFVQMPSDLNYWRNRYRGARVDFSLSFGMFDEGRLVGFIINGVDYQNGDLTAFNTGTGVIPEYRGQKIVDQLYDFAFLKMKEKGITKCALEVIEGNDRAISVYKRVGFSIKKKLLCFKGDWKLKATTPIIEQVDFSKIIIQNIKYQSFYSWDNTNNSLQLNTNIYEHFFIKNETQKVLGYFSIQPKTGYVAQLEIFENNINNWENLFKGIQEISPTAKINNVDSQREVFVQSLLKAGLKNHINQFEMVKWI